MADSIENLAARIAKIEDVEEIRRLKARYLRACDLKQVEDVRTCFLPGEIRIDYQGFPLFTDRDKFAETYREMACRDGVYDLHHASNADIELTGPDTATGRWSLNFRTILLAARQVTRLAVEYEDRYRKHDGRWWISETASRITSCLTEEIGEDGRPQYLIWGEVPVAPAPAG